MAQAPFHRGVALSSWFQANNAGQIQLTKFTRQDFSNIKSLGFDVIRLPIALHAMSSGDPDYTLDPLLVSFLDSAVTWAEDLQINLILDNHSADPVASTDPSIESPLIKVWTQIAQHYKDRSKSIYYELLNEPHGISQAQWGTIQQHVIDAIRSVDTKHSIVVCAVDWDSYQDLQNLPVYSDTNLLYTFHFYEPFLFTSQGASWTLPSMETVHGIPFPYNAAIMPPVPDVLKGTWVEDSYNSYDQDGTMQYVKAQIDLAINFRNSRNVKIYDGEMGVYNLYSSNEDRRIWYDSVRTYFEANDIPWIVTDYNGDFGIFKKFGNDLFDSDLDTSLVMALGLNVPPQHSFTMKPDTAAFPIYRDYIENGIYESSYDPGGTINFYSGNNPGNGLNCIFWKAGAQYNTIGFDFKPDKDLSYLEQNGYALDLMVRGTLPDAGFDVRFLDTKTSAPDDHPWRMAYSVTGNMVPRDGKWHHLHIPLSDFFEQGSFDSIWYNQQGLFDWSATDRFEIVAADLSITDDSLWFDNIRIIGDTSSVTDTTSTPGDTSGTPTILRNIHADPNQLSIIPNPVTSSATITYFLEHNDHMVIRIFTVTGQKVITLLNAEQSIGSHRITWNCVDKKGLKVEHGIYICTIQFSGKIVSEKIVVQ